MSRSSISKNTWKIGCVASRSTKRAPGSTRRICSSKLNQPPRRSAKSSKITKPPLVRYSRSSRASMRRPSPPPRASPALVLLRLSIADFSGLQREVGQELFHLRVVLRLVRRVLLQLQGGDLPVDRLFLVDELLHRRIARVDGQRGLGAPDAEEHRRRQL